MEKTFEPNYTLDVGDVVLIAEGGYGLVWEDKEKYVEIIGKGEYFGREGVRVKPYQCKLETLEDGTGEMGVNGVIGYETFGDAPMILLNTFDENVKGDESPTPTRIKIRVNTSTHEYQGLYCGAVIDGHLGINGEAYFKHNGKDWMLDAGDFQVVGEETGPVSALDKQVSGGHYKGCKIQPVEYIHANGLDYFQGNVVKYVTRHKLKNGKADIEKAIHYLELILELQYGE